MISKYNCIIMPTATNLVDCWLLSSMKLGDTLCLGKDLQTS